MNEQEFKYWQAVTESSQHCWTEDEIYRLNGRGAFYYTGGENGHYMKIGKDGLLSFGTYEGAIPHIGEASFRPQVEKQTKDFNEAFKLALSAGGKKFLVDMFRGNERPSVHPAHLEKTEGKITGQNKTEQINALREKCIGELYNTVTDGNIDRRFPNATRDYKIEAAKILGGKEWPGPEADVKIAQALLTQGYDRPEVHRAISLLSPETAGKARLDMVKYSQEVTEKALTPEIKRQIQDFSRGNSLRR